MSLRNEYLSLLLFMTLTAMVPNYGYVYANEQGTDNNDKIYQLVNNFLKPVNHPEYVWTEAGTDRVRPIENGLPEPEIAERVRWIRDRVDSKLRERFPETMSNIPKPSVDIRFSSEYSYAEGGMVSGDSFCYDLPLPFSAGETPDFTKEAPFAEIQDYVETHYPSYLGEIFKRCDRLPHIDVSLDQIAGFIESYNQHNSCKLVLSESQGLQYIKAGEGCTLWTDPNFPSGTFSRTLIAGKAIPEVSLGPLPIANLQDWVSTLDYLTVHELAHRYLAHGAMGGTPPLLL